MNKFDKNNLDELVEAISLSHHWVIKDVPVDDLFNLKKEFESREELFDYKFEYIKPLKEFNILIATKMYGKNKNA